nr:MAG TPA: hypothetical protein [Caudoviricetes sp.]
MSSYLVLILKLLCEGLFCIAQNCFERHSSPLGKKEREPERKKGGNNGYIIDIFI